MAVALALNSAGQVVQFLIPGFADNLQGPATPVLLTDWPRVGANAWSALDPAAPRISVSNAGAFVNANSQATFWSWCIYNTPIFPADQWVQFRIANLTGSSASSRISVVLRGSVTVNNAYLLEIYTGFYVVTYAAGTAHPIQTATAQAWNIGDMVYFGVQGQTLELHVNGVLVNSWTNAAVTSGQPGIGSYGLGSSAAIDTWTAGTVFATGTYPMPNYVMVM